MPLSPAHEGGDLAIEASQQHPMNVKPSVAPVQTRLIQALTLR
jgi:hypothetical protein